MKTEYSDDRIVIRRYKDDDLHGLYEAVRESIPAIFRWADWAHPDYTIEETKKWVALCGLLWDKNREYHFLITDKNTGEIIGGCGLNAPDMRHRVANIGYWVRTKRTGQGVATSAVRLLALFCFNELNLERLELTIHPENMASRRVAEKAGARYEITLPNRIRFHDRQHDARLYSILKGDITN